MVKVVLDTNVYVSGLIKRGSKPDLVYIRSIATVVGCLPEVRVIDEDPADNIILACAESAGADYIVSGDRHLRKLREYKGIRILSPAEFLEITGCSPSEA